jgi:hypothetical protein
MCSAPNRARRTFANRYHANLRAKNFGISREISPDRFDSRRAVLLIKKSSTSCLRRANQKESRVRTLNQVFEGRNFERRFGFREYRTSIRN